MSENCRPDLWSIGSKCQEGFVVVTIRAGFLRKANLKGDVQKKLLQSTSCKCDPVAGFNQSRKPLKPPTRCLACRSWFSLSIYHEISPILETLVAKSCYFSKKKLTFGPLLQNSTPSAADPASCAAAKWAYGGSNLPRGC